VDSNRAAAKAAPCKILLRITANLTNALAAKITPTRSQFLALLTILSIIIRIRLHYRATEFRLSLQGFSADLGVRRAGKADASRAR